MFLVLFGGIFGDQEPVAGRPDPGRRRARCSTRCRPTREAAFDETFEVDRTDDLDAALDEVRKGDADVAVEMQGDDARGALHPDRPGQGRDHPGRAARLRRRHQRRRCRAGRRRSRCATERVEDDSLKTIQYVTPGPARLGRRDERRFGAAATLNGWRQNKLLRRLQLAPVSTRTVVGARVAVTIGIALVQMAIFLGLGVGGVRAAADRRVVAGDPAAGRRHAVLHGASGCWPVRSPRRPRARSTWPTSSCCRWRSSAGSFFPLDAAPEWLQARLARSCRCGTSTTGCST